MLKRTLCRAEFTWELECEGPLLIADGRYPQLKPRTASAKEGYPQAVFISHSTSKQLGKAIESFKQSPPELKFYVPGTSLRGPFRAQAERIIRSLSAAPSAPHTACDPFQAKDPTDPLYACSKRLESRKDSPPAYARACPACRLFGCAGLASRIQFQDAALSEWDSVYRDMIGIDRFTGGVHYDQETQTGANMKLHLLENSRFTACVRLTNFELWHIGLLAYVFCDFYESLVPIGFGKTKGFGMIKGKVSRIELDYTRESSGIEHLGSLMTALECDQYDVRQIAAEPFDGWDNDDTAGASEPGWMHRRTISEPDNIQSFLKKGKPYFNHYIDTLQEVAP